MKVFLSSTYLDLIEHRKAVIQGLRTMGEEVDHMEIFGARNEESKKASLEELDECQILVGIYAYRYGTVPKGSKTSVTEQEYLHAASKKIPILVFVVNEDHDWPPKKIDKSLTKVNKFKAKASSEHTPAYFTTPDNLATQVVAAVGKHAKKLKAKKRKKLSAKSLSSREALPKEIVKGVRDDVRGSTLPNQPYFFGREKELKQIEEALSPDSRTWGALIDGPGGIGKTALSIKAAHDASEKLFERKIFITAKVRELTPEGEKPLKDFSRDNYFSMLNELALELGEEGIPRLAPDERANQLRMAMAGKKTLIVFDNLETLSEDERTRLFQFLSRLPEGNKAIVTSRRRADVDARVIRLDRLSADEALALISELAKNNPRLAREDEKDRRDLYEITNGNPLLIKWVCGQLGREGSAMHTIAEAHKFIENAPKGNDPLEYIFGDLLETFTESETKVLAALTHFTQPAKLKWIADITGLTEQAAETALEDLADRSILIVSDEGREFFLPALATQFIREKQPIVINDTGNRLADRAYELTMQYGGFDNFDGFKLLEVEWLSVFASLPIFLKGENKRLQDICDELANFLIFSGHWDEAIILLSKAEEKASTSSDNFNRGTRALDLGWIYSLRQQSTETLACAARAENYWQEFEEQEKSATLRLRGIGYELEGNFTAAIDAFRKVLELRRIIEPESIEVAISLNDLAGIESASGDHSSAEQHFSEAIQLAKKLEYHEGIAYMTGNRAAMALNQEKWSKAERLSKEALLISEQVGRQDLIGEDCYRIAKALTKQGYFSKAMPFAQRAINIFTQLQSFEDIKRTQETLMECKTGLQVENRKKPRRLKKK